VGEEGDTGEEGDEGDGEEDNGDDSDACEACTAGGANNFGDLGDRSTDGARVEGTLGETISFNSSALTGLCSKGGCVGEGDRLWWRSRSRTSELRSKDHVGLKNDRGDR